MHSKNNQRRQGSPGGSGAPVVQMKGKVSVGQAEVEPLQFRVPREFPHSRFSRAPLAVYPPKGGRTKACVSLPVVSLEKMPCFSRSEGAHVKVNSTSSTLSVPSSTTSSTSSSPLKPALTSPASQKNQEKLLNGRGPVTPRPAPRSTTPPQLIDRRPSPSRSPLDKHTPPSPSPSPSTSPSSSSSSHKPSSSPSPSTPDRRPGVPPSPSDKKQPNGAKGSRHRKVPAQLQPVHQRKGRVFDPNKHCGVLDPESQRPCTRSLTCKTHSLAHRRAVPGRKRAFDILLAEHKGRANEKEAGQKKETASSQSAQCTASPDTSSSLSTGCNNGKATPTLKLRLANAHTHRGSGGGGAVVLSSTPVPVPVPAPDPVLPSWQKFGGDAPVSSDEGEAELPEEKPAYHHTPSHPQPISWCGFSTRLMGRGHFVFDRRWDRMRLALHCMVEKHLNAQMWRKVPLVADCVVSTSPLQYPAVPSPTPALPHGLDGVSVVSYSTPFSHNGTGVFCIRDPDPGPGPAPCPAPRLTQTKTAKPVRTAGEGAAAKRRKPPPTSDTAAAYRKNGNSGYHPPPGPAHISNGAAALSVRAKAGSGDSDRYSGVELPLPPALTGDHGGVSSLSPLPCGPAHTRKRRTPGPGDRPGKISRTTALATGIFRKNSAALLSSSSTTSSSTTPETTSHNSLSRPPKVHH